MSTGRAAAEEALSGLSAAARAAALVALDRMTARLDVRSIERALKPHFTNAEAKRLAAALKRLPIIAIMEEPDDGR